MYTVIEIWCALACLSLSMNKLGAKLRLNASKIKNEPVARFFILNTDGG
jgi:hypothetical protein